MTSIVVLDNMIAIFGGRSDFAALKEERTHEYMVPPQLPVIFNETAVKPGEEEDSDQQGYASPHADDDTDCLVVGEGNTRGAAFPYNKHCCLVSICSILF